MSPMMKKLSDFAIVIGVTAGISLLIITIANSLVAKAPIWKSYALWLAFVSRSDIVATSLMAIAVTMAVAAYQQNRGKR